MKVRSEYCNRTSFNYELQDLVYMSNMLIRPSVFKNVVTPTLRKDHCIGARGQIGPMGVLRLPTDFRLHRVQVSEGLLSRCEI